MKMEIPAGVQVLVSARAVSEEPRQSSGPVASGQSTTEATYLEGTPAYQFLNRDGH